MESTEKASSSLHSRLPFQHTPQEHSPSAHPRHPSWRGEDVWKQSYCSLSMGLPENNDCRLEAPGSMCPSGCQDVHLVKKSYWRGTVLCQRPQDPVWVCGGGDKGETISGFFWSWWPTLENKLWGLGKRHCMSVQVPGSWQKENFNRLTDTLYVKILSLQSDNGIISLDPWQSSELKRGSRDFPSGPVVNTLPSNAGGVGSIPELRSHMFHGQKTKT